MMPCAITFHQVFFLLGQFLSARIDNDANFNMASFVLSGDIALTLLFIAHLMLRMKINLNKKEHILRITDFYIYFCKIPLNKFCFFSTTFLDEQKRQ